jgi:dienelactone hydrolase
MKQLTSVARLVPVLALVAALALVAGSARASTSMPMRASDEIVARDYDLGVRLFPQPRLPARLANMPIRLWGTIAAPATPGPHPVVLIVHGAHGDNCPIIGDGDSWPCWKHEQRNDLGFRTLAKGLAAKGFVTIAPDVNGAYSGGWGEVPNKEQLRFRQLVDATLTELALANAGARTRFAIPLRGKVDLARLGVLGHSRGGMNVLRWSKGWKVNSVFLLAPFFDRAQRIPNVPATVLLGTCDFDTHQDGAGYVAALKGKPRTTDAFQLTLSGANHNFYNQTLVAVGKDDAEGQKGRCARPLRLTGDEQQALLQQVVIDHFSSSLLGAEPAAWMTAPAPGELYGRRVAVKSIKP